MLDNELVSQIRDSLDSEQVADLLGLETKSKGNRISILCPRHNDRHFGSCILTARGFHCFACEEKGDIIELTQAVLNCDFREAVQALGDFAGIKVSESTKVEHFDIIRKAERELIGLSTKPVRKLVDIELKYRDGILIGRTENMKTVFTDPLLELYKTDKNAYNELIVDYCNAAIKKRQDLYSALLFPQKLPLLDDVLSSNDPAKEVHQWFLGYAMKQLQEDANLREIVNVLENEIKQIEKINLKHGESAKKASFRLGEILGQALYAESAFV